MSNMTREDIIRMAREADLYASGGDVIEALERFAALVAAKASAAERDRMCEQFNIPKELVHEKAKSNEAD